MKLIVRWVGKTKNPYLASLIIDYHSRIRSFVDLTLSEVKPVEPEDPDRVVVIEGKRLLNKVSNDDYLISLDPKGYQLSSEKFAEIIAERREHSMKKLIFFLGGPRGLSDAVKSQSHQIIALSSMTFSHEMVRLIFLEQIYRAFTLIHHFPYHK